MDIYTPNWAVSKNVKHQTGQSAKNVTQHGQIYPKFGCQQKRDAARTDIAGYSPKQGSRMGMKNRAVSKNVNSRAAAAAARVRENLCNFRVFRYYWVKASEAPGWNHRQTLPLNKVVILLFFLQTQSMLIFLACKKCVM